MRCGLRLQQWCCIGPLVEKLVFSQVRHIYDVYQNFVVCSNHALHLLDHISIEPEAVATVKSEVMKNLDEATHRIMGLRSGYPSIMRQVDL